MTNLSNLKNSSRKSHASKRVGRGSGSGLGKTSGRGQKGDGSRSGYKRRLGKEGGQLPMYMKMPIRGFTRGRFQQPQFSINLNLIEKIFEDGETVNLESLKSKGVVSGAVTFVKVLGEGEITKKLTFEVSAVSASAQQKIEKAGSELKLV